MSDEVQQRAVPTSVLGTAATGRRDRTAGTPPNNYSVEAYHECLCLYSTYISIFKGCS
jgi:hypothetical protein